MTELSPNLTGAKTIIQQNKPLISHLSFLFVLTHCGRMEIYMIIRQEQPYDYDEVYELVKISFATSSITASENIFTELLLSPISVHPNYFRRGIARAMIKEAFQIAKNMGYTAVFLCGDPDFYHKIGFKPSYQYSIFHIADKTKMAEWCMAFELIDGALNTKKGTINIQ